MRPGFFFLLNIAIALVTVLLYYSPHVPPSELWIAAFLPMLIPAFIILNLIFVIFWLFKYWQRSLLSLLVVLAGYNYITRAFAFSFKNGDSGGLKVISYNVRVFNVYAHLQDENQNSSRKMINWLSSSGADVLCLQEFYDHKSSKVYNSMERIGKAYPYSFSVPFLTQPNAMFGMVIFSKLPVVNTGILRFKERSNNQIIYADILYQKDTVRIYNMHLQSMALEEKDFSLADGKWRDLMRKVRAGSVQRTAQIKALLDHINLCPYPVILAGDLNDTPYSYSYQAIKKPLRNAFEKAGRGLGFSYKSRLPLRIDHQFASPELEIKRFITHKEVTYSDHFPLEGVYSMDK
ncbi:MAG: endonuclease/exonuclease/phosphatase family protein [Cytophagaceae bacterium]